MARRDTGKDTSSLTEFDRPPGSSEGPKGFFSRLFWRREEGSSIPPASLPPASSLRAQPHATPASAPVPRRDSVKAKEASATNGHVGKDAAAAAAVTSPSDIGGTGSQPPTSLMSAPEPVASPPLLGKLLGISGEDAATRKKYWMPDELSTTCYDCETVFSTFKRRHHCRVCGQVFCSSCSAQSLPGEQFGYLGPVRVCNYCYNLHNTGSAAAGTPERREKKGIHRAQTLHNMRDSKETEPPVSETHEADYNTQEAQPGTPRDNWRRSRSFSSNRTRTIVETTNPENLSTSPIAPTEPEALLSTTLQRFPVTPLHPARARKVSEETEEAVSPASVCEVEVEKEIVKPCLDDADSISWTTWLINGEEVSSANSGSEKNLLDLAAMVPADGQTTALPLVQGEEPEPVEGATDRPDEDSSYQYKISQKMLTRKDDMMFSSDSISLFPEREHARRRAGTITNDATSLYHKISDAHLEKVVQRLVETEQLSPEWQDIITGFVKMVCNKVILDVKSGDDLDIRHFVKVKKIVDGTIGDCTYIEGLACSKNVAHKKMKAKVQNPRILLLSSSLEFQRTARFSSFDALLQQEKQHLQIVVNKIAALKPDVVVVEKTVSRLALEFLLKANISLVLNVKPSLMQRISRFTNAEILPSTDNVVVKSTTIGTCQNFRVALYKGTWGRKTLLFFEGCRRHLGCSIILRGGDAPTLQKAKRALLFAVHVGYNLHLEQSVLFDICATPTLPEPKEAEATSAEELSSSADNGEEEETDAPTPAATAQLTGAGAGAAAAAPALPVVVSSSACVSYPPMFKPEAVKNYSLCFPINAQHPNLVEAPEEDLPAVEGVRSEHLSGYGLFDYKSLFVFEDNKADEEKGSGGGGLEASTEGGAREGPLKVQKKAKVGESPYNEQSIVYMHSLCCRTTSFHCLPFKIHLIDFYSLNDMTLGQFLERYCFDTSYKCTNKKCGRSMMDHERAFLHANGRINVTVYEYKFELPVPKTDQVQIFSFCKVCGKATPFIPMSEETWKYSFGKFLELTYYNEFVKTSSECCGHSPHKDHTRCFFSQKLVAHFEYEPVGLRSLIVPPFEIEHRPEIKTMLINKDLEKISRNAQAMYDTMQTQFKQLEAAVTDPEAQQEIKLMLASQQSERANFFQTFATLQNTNDYLELNKLKRNLRASIMAWSARVEKIAEKLPKERQAMKESSYFSSASMSSNKSGDRPGTAGGGASLNTSTSSTASFSSLSGPATAGAGASLSSGSSMSAPPTPSMGSTSVRDKLISGAVSGASPRPRTSAMEGDGMTITAKERSFARPTLSTSPADTPVATRERASTGVIPVGLPRHRRTSSVSSSVASTSPSSVPTFANSMGGGGGSGKTVDISLAYVMLMQEKERMEKEAAAANGEKSIDAGDADTDAQQQQQNLQLAEKIRESLAEEEAQETIDDDDDGNGEDDDEEEGHVSNDDVDTAKNEGLEREESQVVLPGGDSDDSASEESSDAKKAKSENESEGEAGGDADEKRATATSAATKKGGAAHKQPIEFPKLCSSPSLAPEAGSLHLAVTSRLAMGPSKTASSPAIPLYSGPAAAQYLGGDAAASLPDVSRLGGEEHNENESSTLAVVRPRSLSGSSSPTPAAMKPTIAVAPPLTPPLARAVGERDALPQNKMVSSNSSHAKRVMGTSPDQTNGFFLPSTPSDELPAPTVVITPGRSAKDKEKEEEAATEKEKNTSWRKDSRSLLASITALLNGTSAQASTNSPLGSLGLGLILPPGVDDVVVIVNKDQPSSIIAYTLSSIEYRDKLGVAAANADPKLSLLSPDKFHIDNRFSFEEEGGKTGAFMCVSYYARQFSALRKLCSGGDSEFIQSLARCKAWQATGGKSGSAFARTLDGRYVLKGISDTELRSFLSFGPSYFEYIHRSYFFKIPTTLAKIVGLFSIQWRSATGRAFKQDLVVMENLFYARNIEKTFDLKGSLRGRYVEVADPQANDQVLLDENLLESLYAQPMCIKEGDKIKLSIAVWNDSLFLDSLGVMDYSLLVGLDKDKSELVVGIIDYMRKYTLDKRMEELIKSSGLMGGRGKLPTILQPAQYKSRFRDAMWRYFIMVPDKYTITKKVTGEGVADDEEEGADEEEGNNNNDQHLDGQHPTRTSPRT